MLKYKVGQHTETLDGYNAVIIGVNENQPFPYQIQDLDTGDIDWCGEGYLSLNVDVLQSENERLKARITELEAVVKVVIQNGPQLNPDDKDFAGNYGWAYAYYFARKQLQLLLESGQPS